MKKELIFFGIACHFGLWAGWSSPIDVYTENPSNFPAVGIDADGNAIVGYYWQHIMDSNIGATHLIDGTPMDTVTFFSAIGSAGIASLNIAVNASGNATLIWSEYNPMNNSEFLRSTSLLNGTWSSPVSLTDPSIETVATISPPGITIDGANNSIGVWVPTTTDMLNETTVNYTLYTSGSWGMETELTMPSTDFIPNAIISGNASGHAFSLWPDLTLL